METRKSDRADAALLNPMPPGEPNPSLFPLEYESAEKEKSRRDKILSTLIGYGGMLFVFIPLMVLLSLAVEREEKDASPIWLRVPTLIVGIAVSMFLYAAFGRLLRRALNINDSPILVSMDCPMIFIGIDHPAISADDVRKLAAWYCETMDMKIVRDDGKEPPSLLLAWSDDLKTNSMLELMPVKHPGPSPRDLPRPCPGLRHFAVRVTDFDQAYARVKAAGVEFLFEPTTAVGGGRVVSFRDPDGNEVQIVQR